LIEKSSLRCATVPSPNPMPALTGNSLSRDTIWEASSPSELSTAITTKQVSPVGHPSDLLRATSGCDLRDGGVAAWPEQLRIPETIDGSC